MASLRLTKEQFSCDWQSLLRPVSSRISSPSLATPEKLIPCLKRKDWILRALFLAVTSLWPHKVGSKNKIHSVRCTRLMMISEMLKVVLKAILIDYRS